jgi:hypothetical protein
MGLADQNPRKRLSSLAEAHTGPRAAGQRKGRRQHTPSVSGGGDPLLRLSRRLWWFNRRWFRG